MAPAERPSQQAVHLRQAHPWKAPTKVVSETARRWTPVGRRRGAEQHSGLMPPPSDGGLRANGRRAHS